MEQRRKWAFWGFVLAAAVALALPSTFLVNALRDYERFVSGFEPAPLRPTRMKSIPHRDSRVDEDARLSFVEFRLKAPKARAVELIGDFNGWRPGTLALERDKDGVWELLLPLPPGHYRYAFVVDGERRADPAAPAEHLEGEPASARRVP